MSEELQVAVLVENHPYDIVRFQEMLDSFAGCKCYVQPIDLFVQDARSKRMYDVVLWYNMNWNEPEAGTALRKYMETEIGATSQGVVLLHHALLSFQGWSTYTEVCGVSDRGGDRFRFHPDETVKQHILPVEHPVTEGMDDFVVTDETYSIGEPDQPGNTILITTDNTSGTRNIAWTRRYHNSRVFCYASGHDDQTYANESFRKLVWRGIQWASGKN